MSKINNENSSSILMDLELNDGNFNFNSNISTALDLANLELDQINSQINETLDTISNLTPSCDKLDYTLAISSGALAGLIDIFLVGKPGESPIGNITDKWFEERTKDFAKLCGWNGENDSLDSAIRKLEKVFKIPYDQTGVGDAGKEIFELNAVNHHFKSLGHNPTLLGLFFSIFDQFADTSHFVTDGKLTSLQAADGSFELRGKDIPSKLVCGFINWFGHLISDVSGSSGSNGRGMGIPSPLWTWMNDIIAIKSKLNIPVTEFDRYYNELALKIYTEGYDVRLQTAQLIPVFVNETLVRILYSTRRLIKYFKETDKNNRNMSLLWQTCEPFKNASVKRMLTVAHGTFCLLDIGDATINGVAKGMGTFNYGEFIMRVNIPEIGRFAISLYGEYNNVIMRKDLVTNIDYLNKEKAIVEDYIGGLNQLAMMYNDRDLINFVDDLKQSNLYKQAFNKTIELAEKRNVSENKILKSLDDIDKYFSGGNV